MFDVDLEVGDKIMYMGNEQTEYFTFGKVYEVVSLKRLCNWGSEIHLMVLDDAEEENCISIPFYKRNFKKVLVVITVFDDDTFTTETESNMLNWNNYDYTLDLLINLLISLGIGYSIVDMTSKVE